MGAPNPDVTALVNQLALQHWTVGNTPDLSGVIAAVTGQLQRLGGEINTPVVAFANDQLDALFAAQEATETAHGSTVETITAFIAAAELILQRALGTPSNPLPITSGGRIGSITAQGFTSGGQYGIKSAEIRFTANDNYTATAQGSSIRFLTTASGTIVPTTRLTIDEDGSIIFPAGTSTGTPGDATINATSGRSAIAAGASTVTITNSLVAATSLVFVALQTNDATAILKNVVPGAGSFVVNLTAAATANTNFGWIVFN